MPRELARVMTEYQALRKTADPLLSELSTREKDYILFRDVVIAAAGDLARRLAELKVTDASDPRAANDPAVADWMETHEKFASLMADRHAFLGQAAKQAQAIRAKVVKLNKDVDAVIKAKSGFFSRSKSLPQLKTLSAALFAFADELEQATAEA